MGIKSLPRIIAECRGKDIEVQLTSGENGKQSRFLMFVWPPTRSLSICFSHFNGWTTCAGRIQGQQWWPVGGAHLAARGLWFFCLVNHIPSDSRCPVRNSSHSSPASYVFCILKVVLLPLVTPGGCVGAGHHIGQPCCSGCPRAAVNQQRRPPCVEGMGWLMFGSTDVIFL